MRIGVQLPEIERDVRWHEYVAMARAAEEAGFDSIWLGDHLLYRDSLGERGPRDVWTQLAGLAAVTERVRLGPLVACTAFHRPGLLARLAASVDEISGGRLVVGLGAGWNEIEFRAFGIPFDNRVARFGEAFEIIRRLLAGEHVTFAGRFYGVEDAVLLPRPARRPPLMVGTNGPRMLAITLPHVAPGTRGSPTTATPPRVSPNVTPQSARRPNGLDATRPRSPEAPVCSSRSRVGATRGCGRRHPSTPTISAVTWTRSPKRERTKRSSFSA
jgi:alkanesulfonate monooxygenase SsuD/methylene tetrahydromethanopterin reductase-like flavin-dependent oxidoreductase (luciferase family)